MNHKSYAITNNEEVILEIIEDDNPITMKQIIEKVKKKGWADSTVKTFVRRLVKKGKVRVVENEVQYFVPTDSREKRGIVALHEVVDKFYDGQWSKAVLCYAENDKITQEELEKALEYIRKHK